MNCLNGERQIQVISALVEGNSIRATCRMTGVAKGTVLKLLVEVGKACADYQDAMFRNLSCKRVQVDEIWAFCGSKEKNVPKGKKGKYGYGDCWTFTALDADTKLIVSWLVARKNLTSAQHFMHDLAQRMAHRVQLTTDGYKVYINAVEEGFGSEVDYSMLVKIYGNEPNPQETRYSPALCLAAQPVLIQGKPDPKHVSTSFVERQNLTMRMHMRRFTRLTNAFSKKVQNLEAAVALHFMWYNFGRIHQTLRVTPAMQAGLAQRPWTIEDILGLLVR